MEAKRKRKGKIDCHRGMEKAAGKLLGSIVAEMCTCEGCCTLYESKS